jgi:hypothetical protein
LSEIEQAGAHLEAAVDGLREAGGVDDVPLGLLARAELHRRTGAWALAAQDLEEVYEIATRSHMRLFEIDAMLEHARLTLARAAFAGIGLSPGAALRSDRARPEPTEAAADGILAEIDAGAGLAARAKTLIDETGYRRRIPDHALVAARIAAMRGDAAKARTYLAEAQKWIDDGWRCHVGEHAEIAAMVDGGGSGPAGGGGGQARKPFWRRLTG